MRHIRAKFFDLLSSPRLTVFLLIYAAALIFMATLEQPKIGIEAAQARYFESWFCMYPAEPLWGVLKIPLCGGAFVGMLAVVNILFAGFKYTRADFESFWLTVIHLSIALLIVSGFIQNYTRVQAYMTVREGETQYEVRTGEGGVKAVPLKFGVKLVNFEEEKWADSDIAKNYSSTVVFVHGAQRAEFKIEMNRPASFGGWTFYQSSFADGGKVSVLNAVSNPAKILPWFSVGFAFLGMFMMFVSRFFIRKNGGARK